MNNFDTSSKGVNLDLSCFFDNDQGKYLFNENFVNVYRSGGSLLNDSYFKVDCWLFTDYGNFDNDFDLADFDNYSFTKNDLKSWLDDEFYLEDLQYISRSYFNKSYSKLLKAELLELLENETNSYDRIDNCNKHFKPKFKVLAIRGHSQGDYAEIIFRHCDIEQYNFEDKEKFLSMMEVYFTDLLYNAPLFCRLTINDDIEINLHECIKNEYEYNKGEVLDQAKQVIKHEKKEYIVQWLDENLPDQPEHN